MVFNSYFNYTFFVSSYFFNFRVLHLLQSYGCLITTFQTLASKGSESHVLKKYFKTYCSNHFRPKTCAAAFM